MKKGWTLEQLAYELRSRGFATAVNKLWRLENKPPKRLDTELLMWLEKVLQVEILEAGDKKHVFIEDVLELIDHFIEAKKANKTAQAPSNSSLLEIYRKLRRFGEI